MRADPLPIIVFVVGILLCLFAINRAFSAEVVIVRGVAVECESIRKLNLIERKIYVVRFGLTEAEQRVIRLTCKLK
jgi:hypothetical protein